MIPDMFMLASSVPASSTSVIELFYLIREEWNRCKLSMLNYGSNWFFSVSSFLFFCFFVFVRQLVRSGQVRSGQVRSGQVRSGQVRSGQVRSGQVRSGQVRSGQVRSGQVRSGQVRSGQVRSGQVRSCNV